MENVVLKKCRYFCNGLNRYSQRWGDVMLNSTRTLRIITLVGIFCMSLAQANAQQLTVRGKVSDDKGEALPGVNVKVKGAANGVATDAQGMYSISTPANGTLVFNFIGFVIQEVPVNNRASVNVSLVPAAQSLDEVVVIIR
jgi:hypothetical protein